MDAGRDDGLEPVGLGARDTLRLEAALPLYGHELDDGTSPLAAGLARFVKLDGEDFIGRAALLHEQEQGTPRRLVGLEMRGPGIARGEYPVVFEGAPVGVVTSGTHAPTLGRAIALAYVASAVATPGRDLAVEVRGRPVPAGIVPTPFYRRARPVPVAPEPETAPETAAEPESVERPTPSAAPAETVDAPVEAVEPIVAADEPTASPAPVEPEDAPAPPDAREEGES
jgi:hypothetical protein